MEIYEKSSLDEQKVQTKLMTSGRRFAQILILLYIIVTAVSLFINIRLGDSLSSAVINAGIRISIAHALYYGIVWVRYLYCGMGAVTVLSDMAVFYQLMAVKPGIAIDIPAGRYYMLMALLIFEAFYLSLNIYAFMFHKGIREFLNRQRSNR